MPAKYYDAEHLAKLGIKIEPKRVQELVEQAFDETGSGEAGTDKLVTHPDSNTSQFSHHPYNPRYAGFKIVGSSLTNPKNGLERYDVTFILHDRQTQQKLIILDGAVNSEDRTSVFPVIAIDRLAPTEIELEVFVFGAGTYADSSIKFQLALLSHRLKRLSIKGDGTENSKKLAAKYQEGRSFPIEAVSNLEHLATADVIVFATSNVWKTLFTTKQIKQTGFLLMVHLSEGTEIPHDYIKDAIDNKSCVCDGSVAVWHRNGQSLPRYLREQGMTKEEYSKLGIRDICEVKDLTEEQRNKRWLITSVGVATTDLALAEENWKQIVAMNSVTFDMSQRELS